MKKLFTSLMLLVNLLCYGQYEPQAIHIDSLSSTTVLIFSKKDALTKHRNIGSGFLIGGDNRYFIVTATHVLDSAKGDVYIGFVDADGNIRKREAAVLARNNTPWRNHPVADISLMEIIDPEPVILSHLQRYAFPVSQILLQKESIDRSISVVGTGYPIIDPDQTVKAFSINSNFASTLMKYNRSDTKTPCMFQMLEDPCVSGYSGGPVFIGVKKSGLSIGPEFTYLIGIMHGNLVDGTGGKMGMVTPSFYLADF